MFLLGVPRRLGQLREEYGLEDIPLRPGALAIDVGANIGEVAKIFEQQGLRVAAFEPDPTEFRALQYNVSSATSCSQVALWHVDGAADFLLANESGDSSLIEAANHAEGKITVQTQRLDSWASMHLADTDQIQILKLEAEGAEPEILEGAGEMLERVEWIVADVGFERGSAKKTTLPEVVNYLLPRGFQLVDIRPARLVAVFKNTRLLQD